MTWAHTDMGVTNVRLYDKNGEIPGKFYFLQYDYNGYYIAGQDMTSPLSFGACYMLKIFPYGDNNPEVRVDYVKIDAKFMHSFTMSCEVNPENTVYSCGRIHFRKLSQVEKLASGLIKEEK